MKISLFENIFAHLVCVRHCFRVLECISEQSNKKPCPQEEHATVIDLAANIYEALPYYLPCFEHCSECFTSINSKQLFEVESTIIPILHVRKQTLRS